MTKATLLCLGYGYTAQAFAAQLSGAPWRISGTTASDTKAAGMAKAGVDALPWPVRDFDPKWLDGTTALLVSTPPDRDGCPAFRVAANAIAERRKFIHWIGYLSTNGVYGDHQGARVDEESELHATSQRSLNRIRAEDEWRTLAARAGLPLVIFRLPGIYGPRRSALDTVRAGKAKRIFKEGQVFSRMHVDDIAKALTASLAQRNEYDLYNLADDEPAPPQDVIEFACELLGVTPPPLTPIEKADLSPMAKSFYADNKRVSNKRMKDALGLSLSYPTYREGLKAILASEERQS